MDDTVNYFKGLAKKTEPLRTPPIKVAPAKPAQNKPVIIDDDDYKYMSKQASKIGERLSKSASKRYSGKAAPKR